MESIFFIMKKSIQPRAIDAIRKILLKGADLQVRSCLLLDCLFQCLSEYHQSIINLSLINDQWWYPANDIVVCTA